MYIWSCLFNIINEQTTLKYIASFLLRVDRRELLQHWIDLTESPMVVSQQPYLSCNFLHTFTANLHHATCLPHNIPPLTDKGALMELAVWDDASMDATGLYTRSQNLAGTVQKVFSCSPHLISGSSTVKLDMLMHTLYLCTLSVSDICNVFPSQNFNTFIINAYYIYYMVSADTDTRYTNFPQQPYIFFITNSTFVQKCVMCD